MAARSWTVYLFVAINVAAVAIIAARLGQVPAITLSSFTSLLPLRSSCGHLSARDFLIYSQRVVADGRVKPAAVIVRAGRIVDIRPLDPEAAASEAAAIKKQLGLQAAIDYGSDVISPGLVDLHVHFDEPGREDWEGADFGSRAAAAGGVTTVIDMPLNQIPSITTGPLLQKKIAAVKDKLAVDMGMWGGLVPDNAGSAQVLRDMWDLGVFGFKSFMPPAGTDFGHVAPGDLLQAIPILQRLGAFFYVHAETLHDLDVPADSDPQKFATWLAMRPRSFEQTAIRHLVELLQNADSNASQPGFHLHVAHLSDSTSLAMIRTAKQQGLPLSVETCPHYLTFAAEGIPDADTRFKCAPPIREATNRDTLIAALLDGTIDIVASDHSPAPPSTRLLESGDFTQAWGGIAGVQYSLSAAWNATSAAGASLVQLAHWLSTGPAELAGLSQCKGSIAVGKDADFVVWSPESLANTSLGQMQSRHKLTPYTDARLHGRVRANFVRGQLVFDEQRSPNFAKTKLCGKVLIRQDFDTQ